MVKALASTLVLTLGAFAQSDDPKVEVNLDGLRYPPIAAQARIAGDVIFEASGADHQLIFAANPLLAPAAEGNLRKWRLLSAAGKYVIIYSFELLDLRIEERERPIGNKFGRFWLRLLRAPTTKVADVCVENRSSQAGVERRVSADTRVILVSVRGHVPCLEVLNSHL